MTKQSPEAPPARRALALAGACLTQFTVVGLMFAYGVMLPVLEDAFGWSRALLAGALSAAFLMMGVLAMPLGRLSDQLGPRIVLTLAGALYGLGFALLSTVSAPWQLYAIFTLLLALGLGAHDVATLPMTARLFPERRGVVAGLVKCGAGLGQMAVPLAATAAIAALDWRDAVLVLGAIGGALLIAAGLATPGLAAMRRANESRSAKTPEAAGHSFAEARRSGVFWRLCLVQLLYVPALMSVPAHIVIHGQDLGMTPAAAAALLSVIGGASLAGRLALGAALDRIGGRRAYAICLAVAAASLLGLLVVEGPGLYGLMALYGAAHGGLFTIVAPTIAERFGARAHGAIFGAVVFCGMLGGAVGPMLTGWAFDVTGAYTIAFATLAGLTIAALLVVLSLPEPPSAPESAAD